MIAVGSYEAKTHLPQLLDRVEKGERVSISRRGKVVAILMPAPNPKTVSVEEAIQKLKTLRSGVTLGKGLSIKTLINEGRRL